MNLQVMIMGLHGNIIRIGKIWNVSKALQFKVGKFLIKVPNLS